MKKIIGLICFICFSVLAHAQTTAKNNSADSAKKTTIVDASCSSCNFGMKGTGCSLAVRIDGKAYLVEGAKIDDYGDAHAADGMCNMVRKAEVTGKIKGNKYVAKSFKLRPLEKNTN
jgi:hypothetical protein